jgi:hypothetical protein
VPTRGFSRSFPASSITTSAGTLGPVVGPFSIAVVFNATANNVDQGLIQLQTAANDNIIAVAPISDGHIWMTVGSAFGRQTDAYAAGSWLLYVATKATGTSPVRGHLCDMATGVWTHTDYLTLANSANTPVDHVLLGQSFTDHLGGLYAAAAVWNTALTDGQVEGLRPGLAAWNALSPVAMWRMNQAATSDPVTDLTGHGADQIAIEATNQTISSDVPPTFSFDLASVVDGTASTGLGSLAGLAQGDLTAIGSGLADLGALSAVAETAPLPDPDMFVSVLMDELLSCLCENAASQPNPPQHCCFRVGLEVAHDAGILEDLCCEGLAYVTLGDTYPSSTSFPEQDIIRQADAKCAPPTWAQVFQVGIIRCVPTGTEFLPPSCDEWNAASRQNVIDAQTLRRVACCMRNFIVTSSGQFDGMSLVIDRQVQGTPLGGCVERSMKLTAQFPNCEC